MSAQDVKRTIDSAVRRNLSSQEESKNQTKPIEKDDVIMAMNESNVRVGNVTYNNNEVLEARTPEWWIQQMDTERKVFGKYGISWEVIGKIAEWERDQELKTGKRQVTPNIQISEMNVTFTRFNEETQQNDVSRRTIDGNGRRVTRFKQMTPSQQTSIESMRRQIGIEHNMTSRTKTMRSSLDGKEYLVQGGGLLPHSMKMMSIDSASIMIEDLTWMRNRVMQYETLIAELKKEVNDAKRVEEAEARYRAQIKAVQERQAQSARSGRM